MLKANQVLVVGAAMMLASCGSSPVGPTPSPTPIPTAVPTPPPTPSPSTTDPSSPVYCVPAPPPLYTFRIKVFADVGYRKLLDATPQVKDKAYCTAVELPGDICVVRTEGDPMAVTCGNAVAGIASDTRRYGPTWYKADRHPKDTGSFGKLCRPPTDTSDELGCRNHETNQFLVWAYGVGYYTGCGANGACHTFFVEE